MKNLLKAVVRFILFYFLTPEIQESSSGAIIKVLRYAIKCYKCSIFKLNTKIQNPKAGKLTFPRYTCFVFIYIIDIYLSP